MATTASSLQHQQQHDRSKLFGTTTTTTTTSSSSSSSSTQQLPLLRRRTRSTTPLGVNGKNNYDGNNNNKDNNGIASDAIAIQESLQRTKTLLSNELQRISIVQNVIQKDDEILRNTVKTQQSIQVKNAKKALSALERQQQYEYRILVCSILFFYSVIFYIVWCRLLCRLPFVEQIRTYIHYHIMNQTMIIHHHTTTLMTTIYQKIQQYMK